jgi:hypothetical protein
MDDVTRRNAMKLGAAAGGIVLLGSAANVAQAAGADDLKKMLEGRNSGKAPPGRTMQDATKIKCVVAVTNNTPPSYGVVITDIGVRFWFKNASEQIIGDEIIMKSGVNLKAGQSAEVSATRDDFCSADLTLLTVSAGGLTGTMEDDDEADDGQCLAYVALSLQAQTSVDMFMENKLTDRLELKKDTP